MTDGRDRATRFQRIFEENLWGNRDITTGDWRPINLQLAPYHFPQPVDRLNEGSAEVDEDLGAFPDKSLGLWRLADLP